MKISNLLLYSFSLFLSCNTPENNDDSVPNQNAISYQPVLTNDQILTTIWQTWSNQNPEIISTDMVQIVGDDLFLTDSLKIEKGLINNLVRSNENTLNFQDMIFRLQKSYEVIFSNSKIKVHEIWWYKEDELYHDFSSVFVYSENFGILFRSYRVYYDCFTKQRLLFISNPDTSISVGELSETVSTSLK